VRSKKQFNTSTQHDDAPTFFLDRTCGKEKLAVALRTAGLRIEVHDRHFAQNTPDPDWLKACGERGWIVLTADKRIERHWGHVIKASKVAVFIFSSNNAPAEEWVEPIKQYRAKLFRIIKNIPAPFIAHITMDGIGTPNRLRPSRKEASREANRTNGTKVKEGIK
jgi:hypothetical protein